MADEYGPERAMDSQSLGWPPFLLLRTVDTNHRADHDWASRQAGVGRRFAFQVAAPSRLFHITADRDSQCISSPMPNPFWGFLAGRIPAGRSTWQETGIRKPWRGREPCWLCLATKDCRSSAPGPGNEWLRTHRPGATRAGVTAVEKGPCEGGKGASERLGPVSTPL